ncbi:MAG: FecR domain-containing protein, partial [Rhodocyclaceae bacterium]
MAACFGHQAFAAQECGQAAGHVVSIQGRLELRRPGQPDWQAARRGAQVCPGDAIRAQPLSRAALKLANETVLRLDQDTNLTITGGEDGKASFIELVRGAIHALTRTPSPLKVKTPYANASVEGTEFSVAVGGETTQVAAFEGQVAVSNDAGLLNLVAGELLMVAQNLPPRLDGTLRPADTVRWALYYPDVVDFRQISADAGADPAVQESLALYRDGRLAEAIRNLDAPIRQKADTSLLIQRAGLLLQIGRADEAQADLERALAAAPGRADALALQAVIAVTQNDKDRALGLANRAVGQDGKSAPARMALSYVEQAGGRLDAALASVRVATEIDPGSALAWARLAELHLSTGHLDEALAAAQRAESLDPRRAKTQTVLGFSQLLRMNTAAATRSFNAAVELDGADPQPRLGLGLAAIRQGDLIGGREQIEVAASLDPLDAPIRSYLGKAYYEERRNALAGSQYQLAREYDPRDPTPWFYDAFRKRAENRPVESLADLQESVRLNDNRAVYRSRLLLDEDLAARNANQGRLYRGLGFERLALLQAFDSLATDPGNFSAHRLLADAHLAQPRHEVARASELLQAQLTQPANLAPLQLLSAESDLFLLDQAGLRNPGLGEYDPLFARDRVAAQVSLRAGSNDTLAHDLAVSAIHGPIALAVAHSRLSTDGIRANDDLTQDAYGALVQGSLSPSTTLQAEIRKTSVREGDRALRFDPAQFRPNLRENRDAEFARVGFRHAFAPESELLGSLSFRDYEHRISNRGELASPFGGQLSFDTTQELRQSGTLGELQHLRRFPRGSLTVGAGVYRADQDQATDTTTVLRLPRQETL